MRVIYLHWLTPNDLIFWTTDFWWLSEFDRLMPNRTGFYSRCYFWQKYKKKIIKSHVPETGIRPKDEEKHENDANSEVDFRMSRLFRFIPFIRLQGHVRSREPLLTLFHVIDVGFNFGNVQFLHFWEKSLKMKLKNYKTELNSLRRGLIRSRTFKTPKMDLFGSFETIRVCSKNSGNSKNFEIGKIIQNDSMRLANSSLFFMVKYTRGSKQPFEFKI